MIAERRTAESPAPSSSHGPAPSRSHGPALAPAKARAPIPAAFAADTVEGLHAELGPAQPWTYLAILALAATALVALPLVQVDVTFAAPAQVRAAAERSEIRSAVSGRVAHVWVHDNAAVDAGAPLLELDAHAVDARLAHNRARQQRARDVLHDLELLSAAADGVAVFHHPPTPPAAADLAPSPAPLPPVSSPLSPVLSPLSGGSKRQRGDPLLSSSPLPLAPSPFPSLPGALPLASFGSTQDALRFQVSRFRFLRDLGSLPSPAAETGAVAAEVHESSAAGARLRGSERQRVEPATDARRPSDSPHSGEVSPRTGDVSAQASATAEAPRPAPDLQADPGTLPRFRTAEISAEHADYSARRAALLLAAARARAESVRITLLNDRGLVSRRDQEEARFARERAEAEVEVLRQQSHARWQSRRRDEELALIALVSEEAHLGDERTSFTVAAPVAGTLLGLGGLAAGTWVAAGQVLGVISPDDALLVEAAVPPQRIGFLRPGQDVRLAIDTYAASAWGTVGGRIVGISDDLLSTSAGTAFYRVLIAPYATELRRTDGALAPLRKGMTGQARFHLTRRSLLELLHENASHWLDPRRA